MSDNGDYKSAFPHTGRVEWIGFASDKRALPRAVEEAVLKVGTGIEGEHHAQSGESKREVTLIQSEHFPIIASLSGHQKVEPESLRRNIVVSGINLVALKKKQFRIGDVLLEGTIACAPCSRMEENLGAGGYNAMRGHGGLCAKVLEAGTIRVGDAVAYVRDVPMDSEDEEKDD